MIDHFTRIEETQTSKEKETETDNPKQYLQSKEVVNYVCLTCKESEAIPLHVVQDFDRMDHGDPEVPPQFSCESRGGEMYPEYYKGVHGYEYRIADRLGKKEAAEETKVEQ